MVTKARKACVLVALMIIKNADAESYKKKPAHKLVFDNDNNDMFEVTTQTSLDTCIKQCWFARDCVSVNYHSRRKVCQKIYNGGPVADGYTATVVRESQFVYWEKDPSKRQAPVSATESTETTSQSTPTYSVTPNASTQNIYDYYDTTTPHGSLNSETTTKTTPETSTKGISRPSMTTQEVQKSSNTAFIASGSLSTSPSQETKTNVDSGSKSTTPATTRDGTPPSSTVTGQEATAPSPNHTLDHSLTSPETSPTMTPTTEYRVSDSTEQTPMTTVLPPDIGHTTLPPDLCDVDPSHKYCEIYCRPAEELGAIKRHGNLYTIGSKHTYDCYNQTTQKWYQHSIQCTPDGTWNNTKEVCSYHYPILVKKKKRMMYKFVNMRVTKDVAYEKCRQENAYLLKMRKAKIAAALRDNFQKYKGNYWTDANRHGVLDWRTTNDKRVGINGDVFDIYTTTWAFNFIRKHRCARLQPTFRLLPTDCGQELPFICEMRM